MLEYHGGKIYDLVLSRGSKNGRGGGQINVSHPSPPL